MTLVRRESAVEYFKEMVESALANQRVVVDELTTYYVTHLLEGFLTRQVDEDVPLVFKLAAALESGGRKHYYGLKQIGDESLFVSGFFSDSLNRRRVDVDYYAAMGCSAYDELSKQEANTFTHVFAELSAKFVPVMDVLSEVSERTSCTNNQDLLRLYEKWLRTGSTHSAQLLAERGVTANASLRKITVQ